MGHQRIQGNDCEFKKEIKVSKEQFIKRINNDDMMTEILRELTVMEKSNRCSVGLKELKYKELKKPYYI